MKNEENSSGKVNRKNFKLKESKGPRRMVLLCFKRKSFAQQTLLHPTVHPAAPRYENATTTTTTSKTYASFLVITIKLSPFKLMKKLFLFVRFYFQFTLPYTQIHTCTHSSVALGSVKQPNFSHITTQTARKLKALHENGRYLTFQFVQ